MFQKVRFDKIYTYTKYIISKDKDDYQQFVDWVESRSGDIKFWVENWNFNAMNEKLNRIRLSSDEVKKLRFQQGVIKTINENNHDGFNDIDETPIFYTIRYYDKTQKILSKNVSGIKNRIEPSGNEFSGFYWSVDLSESYKN